MLNVKKITDLQAHNALHPGPVEPVDVVNGLLLVLPDNTYTKDGADYMYRVSLCLISC